MGSYEFKDGKHRFKGFSTKNEKDMKIVEQIVRKDMAKEPKKEETKPVEKEEPKPPKEPKKE